MLYTFNVYELESGNPAIGVTVESESHEQAIKAVQTGFPPDAFNIWLRDDLEIDL